MLMIMIMLFTPAVARSQSAANPIVRSGTLIVEAKTAEALISGERPFIVTEKTRITDSTGMRVELSDIEIPCQCEIEYELRMDQDPVCLTVQVK
jgi:hypothetical protein